MSAADQRVLDVQETGTFDDPIVALSTAIEDLAGGQSVAIECAGFDLDGFAQLSDGLEGHDLEMASEVHHDLS